jgi:phosphate transport system permease protein
MKTVSPTLVRRMQETLIYLCGGALAINIFFICGLLGLLVYHGMGYFWPRKVVHLKLTNGTTVLGEVHSRETARVQSQSGSMETFRRVRLKIGNRDLTGLDFRWVREDEVAESSFPEDAVVLERLEYGNFYGTMVELRSGDRVVAAGPDDTWKAFCDLHPQKAKQRHRIEHFEKQEIGELNYEIEGLRLAARKAEMSDLAAEERKRRLAEIKDALLEKKSSFEELTRQLTRMRDELQAESVVMAAVDGVRKQMPVGSIVRAYRPNEMGIGGRATRYAAKLWEFVWGQPRESNTEGGIFPTIFGTVMMVFIMSFAVAPLGVLAAIYLREYAKQGLLVRCVRIAVNNLAGVPSIVFGMFGLGFFVYIVGGAIDKLFFAEALPTPTLGTGGILWASLTLALLTVPVVIVASEEGLAAVPTAAREGSYALGATKFETLSRVVLPAAAPGILTGMILAMARAAGEVAPLMIVGMVKLAPSLPFDSHFPFIHLERKFMHLGFHIYDVGFQSPNVEATRPLVFATALLLIMVVTTVNLAAIGVRNHLRRKYASKAV